MEKITKTEIITDANGKKTLAKTVEDIKKVPQDYLLREKEFYEAQLVRVNADLAEFDKH